MHHRWGSGRMREHARGLAQLRKETMSVGLRGKKFRLADTSLMGFIPIRAGEGSTLVWLGDCQYCLTLATQLSFAASLGGQWHTELEWH
ncbi:hypothetical protein EVAR_3355_1 [Eumeta japonica]|uniref:Uncharacterized protein n=1 Tax=Eumeta variegata TaxID=151549 RepID=A0A4C1SUV6_EUMVA|nr:hypothetical protein EVAR_3355_1 [Eumeta japonica]